MAPKKKAEVLETKPEEKVVEEKAKPAPKSNIILKNTFGEDMDEGDYFHSTKEPGKGKALPFFNKVCGNPVEREDLIEAFNTIFDPKDNILFYKTTDKEVYVIIIPLKLSTNVSKENDSIDGDFQKHAISFINEGSVNIDTLKMKLRRIIPFIKVAKN